MPDITKKHSFVINATDHHPQSLNFTVLYEQQMPGNAAGFVQRAGLCSVTPADIAKTADPQGSITSGCNLNKSSDGNCSPVASCSFLPGTKKWALGSGACRHCLDSIVCGLKWTSLIPVNASKLSGTSGMQRKGTHMLEKQNYKWPWTTDAKEISILKGEKS